MRRAARETAEKMWECDITQAKKRDRKQESIEVNAAEKSGKEMKITLCILYLEVIGDFNKMINWLLGIKARLKGLGGVMHIS